MAMLETTMRERFEAKGYSALFEFSEALGTERFTYRCKSCGAVSEKDIYFLKRKSKRIKCDHCGARSDGSFTVYKTEKAHTIAEFYTAGHSVKETAATFDVSTSFVNNLVKRGGITNGMTAGAYEMQAKAQRVHASLDAAGFELLDSWQGKRATYRVKCKACGAIFARSGQSLDNLRHCSSCQHQKAEERKALEKRCRAVVCDMEKRTKPKRNYYEEARQRRLDEVHTCKHCGKQYTVREYVESAGIKYVHDSDCCSKACSDAVARTKAKRYRRSHAYNKNHRSRCKHYGCEYDNTVNLQDLIKRDGLTCYICGKECDEHDTRWTDHYGPDSPTIDHIIPLSKGGGHVWSNVKVACAMCNSRKGASVHGE